MMLIRTDTTDLANYAIKSSPDKWGYTEYISYAKRYFLGFIPCWIKLSYGKLDYYETAEIYIQQDIRLKNSKTTWDYYK